MRLKLNGLHFILHLAAFILLKDSPVDYKLLLGLPDGNVFAYGRALESRLVCEQSASAERDRGERVVGGGDVQAKLLLQVLRHAAEQSAATRQYQPRLVDVGGHVR